MCVFDKDLYRLSSVVNSNIVIALLNGSQKVFMSEDYDYLLIL